MNQQTPSYKTVFYYPNGVVIIGPDGRCVCDNATVCPLGQCARGISTINESANQGKPVEPPPANDAPADNADMAMPDRYKMRLYARHNLSLLQQVDKLETQLADLQRELASKTRQHSVSSEIVRKAQQELINARQEVNRLTQELNRQPAKHGGNKKMRQMTIQFLKKNGIDPKVYDRFVDFVYKGNNPNDFQIL